MEGWNYIDKTILAPMVRVGTLPARLCAIDYGADIVYTEEIIDRKMMATTRQVNDALGTVDWVMDTGRLVLRTCPEEAHCNVFQMGTADAVRALQVGEMLSRDFKAIDINMGCPKKFSVAGGMGSALLKKPLLVTDILTTLVRNLPIPVTCKIRLLDNTKETIDLIKIIESTGVQAIGVHGRRVPERPREPAHWDEIKLCVDAATVPIIANGDIFLHEDIARVKADTGCQSVMIARGAQWNLSIFRDEGPLLISDVIKNYLCRAARYDNHFANTKYVLTSMKNPAMKNRDFHQSVYKSKAYDSFFDIFECEEARALMRSTEEKLEAGARTNGTAEDQLPPQPGEKRAASDDGGGPTKKPKL